MNYNTTTYIMGISDKLSKLYGLFNNKLLVKYDEIQKILKSSTLENNTDGEENAQVNSLNKEVDIQKNSFLKNFIFGKTIESLDKIENNSFDIIMGDLPFGLQKIDYTDLNISLHVNENWIILFKSLFKLSDKGIGIYYVEPSLMECEQGKKFREILAFKGFYINAVLNAHENFLENTYICPIIVFISRKKTEKLFIAELDGALNINCVVNNYYNNNSINLNEGLFIDRDQFQSIEKYKINSQLKQISNQYTVFKEYSLGELSIEIAMGNSIVKKENSIYISKINLLNIYTDINQIKTKLESYFQLVLDSEIVLADYLKSFFQTEFGKLSLKLIQSGSTVKLINKKDLENLRIPIPLKPLQNEIIQSRNKVEQLKLKLSDFENEIALSPNNISEIHENLNNILNSLNLLNDSDKVLALIRNQENKHVEFKSSIRKSLEKPAPEKEIEKAILKTIAGFLNSEGGKLVVGVDDKGNILGLENDGFKDNDSILKHIKNLLKRDFEAKFYDLIEYRLVNVLKKQILYFECKPSTDPVFLAGQEFYVRSNPATDQLKGKEIYEYIKTHFK